jgi:hypothetical protein
MMWKWDKVKNEEATKPGIDMMDVKMDHVFRLPPEQIHLTRNQYVLQNDLKILAALSLSLSSVVGQNASLPMRLESRFTGAPSLSAQPQTLSKPFLLVVLVVSQDGSLDVTFCILVARRVGKTKRKLSS